MATSSSRGRTSSSSSSSSSSKSSTASSSSSPSSRGNISGSSSPSGSISGGSSSISGSSSVSGGSSYGGFGSSAPSASVSSNSSSSSGSSSGSSASGSISGGSSSGSSASGSISGGGSNTISISNFGNPSFSTNQTSSTISSSGNISSLGQSPYATVSTPNTGLAAFGLQSIQTGLTKTTNQLGQGFQTSAQSTVAATAARLGAALSSFIGPINPTKPTVLTIPEALIPDRPPIGIQPFTVIDLTPELKTTAGDIPKDSQDIPTTLTQNIIKYTPYLILAGIIYAGISLVKK